jgi:hypothetical protein
VVERNGLEGHWASVSGFMVAPRQLKGSLPRDFTVSFDLVAARDYTWGARGMTFRLSKGLANSGTDSIFSVRLRPGFDGKDGETVIEGKFPGAPADFNQTKWVTAPGFSNNHRPDQGRRVPEGHPRNAAVRCRVVRPAGAARPQRSDVHQ